jgi:prolycopene isomerase
VSAVDVVVIGAGLGGLAAAAHLATRGVAVTVLEAHERPGGYATTFERGDFTFEIGLHLLDAVGPGQPGRLVLDALGIGDLDLLSPPHLRREIWPDLDLRVPQGLPAYLDLLGAHFPAERAGMARLAALAERLHGESTALDSPLPRGALDTAGSLGPFSPLARATAGAVVDAHLGDRRLRAVLDLFASGWLGLPLDRLSAIQWLIPWYSYHALGGSYPRGGSSALSQALAATIVRAGGSVRLSTPARRIQVRRGRVTGVELETGELLATRAVVSNVSPQQTFGALLGPDPSAVEARYLARLARMEPSVSCFKVWLGIDSSIDESLDYDTYLAPSYEPRREGAIDPRAAAISVVLPTRLSLDLAPKSRAIVSMSMLVDTGAWSAAESAQPGLRAAAADILIERVETGLLPGLRDRIQARDIATPATFERFTRNPGGSVYGWAARVDQCGSARLDHATPIDGLHLAGAWTRPGGGFTSALRSGLRAARDVLARLPR